MNNTDLENLVYLLKNAKKELEKAEQTIKAFTSQQKSDISDIIEKYLNNAESIIKWIENAL